MNTEQPFLSVIIPAYNEEENIGKGKIREMLGYLRKSDYEYEVIFVDDGSSDNTPMLLDGLAKEDSNVKVIKMPHQGKGPTVAAGIIAARGENRLFTDFDQATPITEIEKLLPFIKKGYEVVIGSREIKGARRDKEPFYRHLMGKGFNLGIKLITLRGIHDTQCGFKLISKKAALDLFPDLTLGKPKKSVKDAFTGSLDVELLFLARKKPF